MTVELIETRSVRSRILRRIAISLVVGAFGYFLTELTGQPEILSLLLSLVFGGITLVVQFLMEFEHRLARVEAATSRHSSRVEESVQVGFTKISDVTKLFSRLEASAVHTDVVTQLVQRAAQLGPATSPLIQRFAQAEIGRLSTFLKDLGGGGSVIYEGEDRDWLLALTRNAEHCIRATSLSTVDGSGKGWLDGGLWVSDFGQRYLKIQREAVRRGVSIRRIFVVADAEPPSEEEVMAVCRQHQDCGIQVRVLDWTEIPIAHRDGLFDFVLFDQELSYEVTPASRLTEPSRATILSTRLELREEWVRDRAQRFDDLWMSAREVGMWGIGPGQMKA